MADFYQDGVLTTLHRLAHDDVDRLEAELSRFVSNRPIGLVLPALVSEFETPAMQRIISALRGIQYLERIVVAVARATPEQFERAKACFEGFYVPVKLIWIDGPRIQSLLAKLEERGLPPGPDGKGRSCWLSYGYLLASRCCDVVALHDCDIVNYDRRLLARLVYPVVHPHLSFEFCKGFYARVTDHMHGRVTRLFMTPLVRALEGMAAGNPFLRYLDSFRYPLAGEFAMDINLARVIRIPSDWGLEVGVLAEMFRNTSTARTCQVDLMDNYEHKHQKLSQDEPNEGLARMTHDIAKSLFTTLAAEGLVFSADHFRSLEVRYVRMAQDTITRYYADAVLNGLKFDRHEEELAVATFAHSLHTAAESLMVEPSGNPLIPNWNRVVAAFPEFFDLLEDAVDRDSRAVAAQSV